MSLDNACNVTQIMELVATDVANNNRSMNDIHKLFTVTHSSMKF